MEHGAKFARTRGNHGNDDPGRRIGRASRAFSRYRRRAGWNPRQCNMHFIRVWVNSTRRSFNMLAVSLRMKAQYFPMKKVSDLNTARALKEWLRRMAEAGWQGHKPGPSPDEGTLGGPTIYLCSVERRVHVAVHLMKEGLERIAEFGREHGLSFEDACNYLGSALED